MSKLGCRWWQPSFFSSPAKATFCITTTYSEGFWKTSPTGDPPQLETHPSPPCLGRELLLSQIDIIHVSAILAPSLSREGWGGSFIISCLCVSLKNILVLFICFLIKTREFMPFNDVLPSNLSSNELQSIIEWTSKHHRLKTKSSSNGNPVIQMT